MKNALFFIAASLMNTWSTSAFAHEGHGLGGSHWHGTDVLGFVGMGAALALIWFKRK